MAQWLQKIAKTELSLTFGADRRSVAIAAAFVIALAVLEGVAFRGNFADLVSFVLHGDELLFRAICAAYVLVSVYLVFAAVLIAISAKWYVRIPLICFFAVAFVAQAGYSAALGRFMIYEDIVSAISATGEQRSDSIAAFTPLWSFAPGLIFAFLGATARRNEKRFGLPALVALLVISVLFLVNLSYLNRAMFDRRFASVSITNVSLAAVDYFLFDPVFVSRKRPEVVAVADPPRPVRNIVLVFDESVRADHLSLNGYSRRTTPYLEELRDRGLLLNYGVATSASTISHQSYDAFITGATPETIEKVEFGGLGNMPTVFQFAKAMNYRTVLIDGQMKRYWGGLSDDLKFIDRFVSLAEIDSPDRIEDWEVGDKITNDDARRNNLQQWEIDRKIARIVSEMITGSTGNFIMIYKRGCHFPYEKNYPAEAETWKPIYRFREQYEIPPADRIGEVKNSYDNGLKYNLDDFFRNLCPDYTAIPNNSLIIYTSDHGESFFAGGRAGHGGDLREEAAVPFFLLGFDTSTVDTEFKAGHANIFSGLLDLMGYPKELRPNGYARSFIGARREDSTPRYYNPPKSGKKPFDN